MDDERKALLAHVLTERTMGHQRWVADVLLMDAAPYVSRSAAENTARLDEGGRKLKHEIVKVIT